VFEAVGRPWAPGPDYAYPYAMLQTLGIRATVSFIPVSQSRRFATLDDAVDGFAWMVPDASAREFARLRTWLGRALAPCDGGLELLPHRTVRWAVLTWTKDSRAA
jgi:hypothetical protein